MKRYTKKTIKMQIIIVHDIETYQNKRNYDEECK